MIQRILVVCVGNICRSPTAEVLFRHYAPDVSVSSAGLAALSGQAMEPAALAVLAEHGRDGSRHVARQLYDGLIRQADLVLGMEKTHVDAMKCQVADARERIFLLDAREQRDIPDPFGSERPVFDEVYGRIDRAVKAWLPRVRANH